MTLLTKAQHESEFESVSRRMSRWVNRKLGVSYHKFCPDEAWTPAINFYEDSVQYHVIVDLAGVKGDKIDLRVDENGAMIMSGERQMPEPPAASGPLKLHLMEIDHGAFCRVLELPENADIQAIEASYRTGFLSIRIPKK